MKLKILIFVSLIVILYALQIEEVTITQIHEALKNKEITCQEVIENHIYRIQKYDKYNTKLNSITSINPHAIEQAKQLDKILREQNYIKGKLFCIPIIVKDNINVFGLPNTAASLALAYAFPKKDAIVVEKLLAENAIIIAKANMYEFAFEFPNSNSSLVGLTLNSYDRKRTTYGSSGGTATAIASSFGVVGLGTDTAGSIVGPSSAQALVGLRPTQDYISINGILPLAIPQDTVGPMCRRAKDAIAVAEILLDKQLEKEIKNIRIGYMRDFLTHNPPSLIPDPEVIKITNDTIPKMESLLKQPIKSIDFFIEFSKFYDEISPKISSCLWYTWFKYGLDEFLSTQYINPPFPNLDKLVESEMYGKDLLNLQKRYKWKETPSTDPSCEFYKKSRDFIFEKIQTKMESENINVIMFPQNNQPPNEFDSKVDGFVSGRYISAMTGMPSIVFPVGFTNKGLPVGMTLLGKRGSDLQLLEIARLFEEKYKIRKPPLLK